MNTGLPSPLEAPSLDDPALLAWLRSYVRRRVPSDEADDVVQAVLCAALEARQRPTDGAGLRRWLTGVARHLIARHYETTRATRRGGGDDEGVEPMQAPPPFEERSLVRWAEEQAEAVAHGPETLDWMAREGEGEKLEAIAREAELPSARVRQRVSRLRRWMKGRYLAELALASTLALALALWWARKKEADAPPLLANDAPAPSASAAQTAEIDRAVREQREAAAGLCDKQDWEGCLEALDAAKRMDPAGDEVAAVQELRRAAGAGLQEAARAKMQRDFGEGLSKEGSEVRAPKPTPKQAPAASSPAIKNATPPLASPPGTTGSQGLPPGLNYRAAPKKAVELSEPRVAPQAPSKNSKPKGADLPNAY
ncbi:MAG TPA: sigma factor [Polyangiaceae bacterium]|nr:sigma factor [Polyangiaceae bacterium]